MIDFLRLQCVMYSIPLILHAFGIYLLHLAKGSKIQIGQRLYLLNLSISEFLICLLGILRRVALIHDFTIAYCSIHLIQGGCAMFTYHVITIFITFDRLFEIFLNIRYPIYFTQARIKKILFGIWGVGMLFTIVLFVGETLKKGNHTRILTYFYPVFGGLCTAVTFVVYFYICKKIYINTKLDLKWKQTRSTVSIKKSCLTFCKKMQGIIFPFLLVTTLVIFVITPELVHFHYTWTGKFWSKTHAMVETTMFFIGYTLDAFLYIFCLKNIRKIVTRKTILRVWHFDNSTSDVQSSIVTFSRYFTKT